MPQSDKQDFSTLTV